MTCAIYINIDINLVILTVFTMLVDLKTGIKTTKEGILVLQNILQQGSLFFEYSYIRQKKTSNWQILTYYVTLLKILKFHSSCLTGS